MFHLKQQESLESNHSQSEETLIIAQKSAELRNKFLQLQETIGALKRLLIRAANHSDEYQDFFKKLDCKFEKISRDCLQKSKDARNLYQSIKKEKGIALKKTSGEYTSDDQFIKNNASYQIQRKILRKTLGVLNKELKNKIKSFPNADCFIEMLNRNIDDHHDDRVLVIILKFIFEHLDIDDVNLKKVRPKLSEDIVEALDKIELSAEQNKCYGFAALYEFLKEENIACKWDPLTNEIKDLEMREKEKEVYASRVAVREEIRKEILDPCMIRKFKDPLKTYPLYLEELEKKLIAISYSEFKILINRLGGMREDICNGLAKEYADDERTFIEKICQLITNQCKLLNTNKKLHPKNEWHINEKDLRAILKSYKPRNYTVSESVSISDFPSVIPDRIEVIFNKQLRTRAIKNNDETNTNSRYSRYFVPPLDLRFPRSKSDDSEIRLSKKSKVQSRTPRNDKTSRDHQDSLVEEMLHQKKKTPWPLDFFTKSSVPDAPPTPSGKPNMVVNT